MPGAYKTPRQIRTESRRLKVASLMMRGITCQRRLAEEVGCTQVTLYKDVKAIRQQWRIEMTEMFDHAKEEQLKKIDKVEEQAWRGWERSIRLARKIITKTDAEGEIELTEATEEQAGDPRFLEVVRKCVEDRRRLLGLDEPELVDIKAQMTVAALTLQKEIEDNGDFIEWKRNLAFGRDTITSLPSNGDQQRQMDAGQTLEVAGYPVGKNGDGKASAEGATVARPRNRLE